MVSGSHVYARRAHVSNRSFVFLLSQVSHMRKKERKREEEFCKTEGGNTRFSMSFPLVHAYSIRLFVKTLQDECVNSSYLVCYKDECDTCDSKNDKTPVMCACAYARRQVIIVILQFIFLQISNLFPTVVL